MNVPARVEVLTRAMQVFKVQLASLEPIRSDLVLDCDRWALDQTVGGLAWAMEYCAVIAKHQVGESLEDGHGYWCDPGVGPATRQVRPGETIAEANARQLRERSQRQ